MSAKHTQDFPVNLSKSVLPPLAQIVRDLARQYKKQEQIAPESEELAALVGRGEAHALKMLKSDARIRRSLEKRIEQTPIAAVENEDSGVSLSNTQVSDERAPSLRSLVKRRTLDLGTLPSLKECKELKSTFSLQIPCYGGRKLEFADVHPAHLPRDATLLLNQLVPTGILSSYGVAWTPKVIARDIWQNFYDGHLQTLEGVRLQVSRSVEDAPYQICIEGGAEYPPHLLIELGGTSKDSSVNTAGHFGEGSKIVALLLLRDLQVSKVIYASANWKLEFTLESMRGREEKMLCYTLSERPDYSGNTLEIETTNYNFIYLLIRGIDNFQHSLNPDLLNPTYENAVGGFRYTPGSFGRVYIGGQAYSVAEMKDEDNFAPAYPNFILFLRRKSEALSGDRDRSALHFKEIGPKIVKPIIEAMTNADIVSTLLKLQATWPLYTVVDKQEKLNERLLASIFGKPEAATSLPEMLIEAAVTRGIRMKFPAHCIAISGEMSVEVSKNERDFLKRRGFQLYSPDFIELGMEAYNDAFLRNHIGRLVAPSAEERTRIGVLRETLRIVLDAWKLKSHRDAEFLGISNLKRDDIYRPVFLFEPPPNSLFASRDNVFVDKSIFWNRSAFTEAPFEQAVEEFVRLQMLKYGSEQSEISSYKITEFIAYILEATINPVARQRIGVCKSIWDSSKAQGV